MAEAEVVAAVGVNTGEVVVAEGVTADKKTLKRGSTATGLLRTKTAFAPSADAPPRLEGILWKRSPKLGSLSNFQAHHLLVPGLHLP